MSQTECLCLGYSATTWSCGDVYCKTFVHWTVFPVLGYLSRGTSQWWWTGTKTEPWRAIWTWSLKIFNICPDKWSFKRKNSDIKKYFFEKTTAPVSALFLHTKVCTLHNIFTGSVSGCPSHVSVLESVLQRLQVWCNHREVRPGWSRDTPLNELLCKCSPLLRPLIVSGQFWQLRFQPSILL